MAVIPVRPHAYAALALVLAGAALALASALGVPRIPSDAHLLALYGGLTLLAQAVAFWYLPSFAKREVVLDGLASYAGPVLFPAALVASLARSGSARGTMLALGLALFPLVLVASASLGPRWRGGSPFWRVGAHRRGDLLAMLTLASACAWLAAAGVLALARPSGLLVAWPMGLALFALGALAHLLPRLRGREALWPLYAAGALAANAGGLLALLVRFAKPIGPPGLAYALLLGLPLAALALVPPGGKRAGPRMSDARPLLLAAFLATSVGLLLLLRQPMTLARASIAYAAVTGGLALAVGAVAILGLPVVFNAVPDARFVAPAAVAALVGALVLAGEIYTGLAPWRGASLLAIAASCYLGALWPLRKPRRECPPPEDALA